MRKVRRGQQVKMTPLWGDQNTPGTTGSSSLGAGGWGEQGLGTHLHKGKLLLAGVVVARGSLVLFGCSRAVLIAELVCGVNQLPRVLGREEPANARQVKNGKQHEVIDVGF